ncbi:hypothetical protein [Sporosarcina psychrophila]|uniref:Membrane protein required for colicin V production n=1 Tax=Sporosarcina psychrophila TaxID=1476 RepID=A0ABV2KHV5_SPOPS
MTISSTVFLIGLVSAIFGLLAGIIGILAAVTGLVAASLKATYWGVKLYKELKK